MLTRLRDWFNRLRYQSCPKCRSLRVREVPIWTTTYIVHWRCRDCGHDWKTHEG